MEFAKEFLEISVEIGKGVKDVVRQNIRSRIFFSKGTSFICSIFSLASARVNRLMGFCVFHYFLATAWCFQY